MKLDLNLKEKYQSSCYLGLNIKMYTCSVQGNTRLSMYAILTNQFAKLFSRNLLEWIMYTREKKILSVGVNKSRLLTFYFTSTFLTHYRSIILQHSMYCNVAWGHTFKSYYTKIDRPHACHACGIPCLGHWMSIQLRIYIFSVLQGRIQHFHLEGAQKIVCAIELHISLWCVRAWSPKSITAGHQGPNKGPWKLLEGLRYSLVLSEPYF